jgi:hypothetical protein
LTLRQLKREHDKYYRRCKRLAEAESVAAPDAVATDAMKLTMTVSIELTQIVPDASASADTPTPETFDHQDSETDDNCVE